MKHKVMLHIVFRITPQRISSSVFLTLDRERNMKNQVPHWSHGGANANTDQLAVYDDMRRRCPIAHSDVFSYSVLGHAELTAVLKDHQTFSNKAGSYASIPNGMDPPQHTLYREVIEHYFTDEAMNAFAPLCQRICDALIRQLPDGSVVEVMHSVAEPFAQQIQCAFMGWPDDLQAPLRDWVKQNQLAIARQDRARLAELALAFDAYIRSELDRRRIPDYRPVPHDITSRLMSERVTVNEELRSLTDDELVSIIRNWTVGELGTISACVGIICHYLGEHTDLQEQLRQHPEQISDAVDEILRIHPPLIANRRRTLQPATLAGFPIPEDTLVTIFWAAANRDERVFGEASAFNPQRNSENNLLYGAGIHQCPGAPLARLELNVFLERLLNARRWHLADTLPDCAGYPAGGFKSVHIEFFDS